MLEDYEPDLVGDRRRHPRTEVLAGLRVTMLSGPIEASVQEISQGGFALETRELPRKGMHHFRFELDGLPPVEVSAELVHVTRVALGATDPFYLGGFELLPSDDATARAVARLVERLAALCPA